MTCPACGEIRKTFEVEVFGGKRTMVGDCRCTIEKIERSRREEESREAREKVSSVAERFGAPVVSPGLSSMALEGFELLEGNEEAFKVARRFVETIDDRLRLGSGILFSGPVGTGKTRLAASIANVVIATGRKSAIHVDVNWLLERIRNLWGQGEKLQMLQSAMIDADLLVLDDLGQEVSSPREVAYLFGWLNSRYTARKSVIVTTNLPLKNMGERYGEAIISRLRERCKLAVLKGKDYRIILREREDQW